MTEHAITLAYRARREAFSSDDAVAESTLVSRFVRADVQNRILRAIAYPAFDPPPAGKGTVPLDVAQRLVDSHGTFMRPKTVRVLMERFMSNGRSMDTDHGHVPGAAFPVESFIVRENDPDFGDLVGSWVLGPKVYRDDVWSRVDAGMEHNDPDGLNGLSIDVFSRFRTVDIDLLLPDGRIERVTAGEFIDPEPIFVSLVNVPSTGKQFVQSARSVRMWSQTSESEPRSAWVHIVRSAPGSSPDVGGTMSTPTPPTPPEVTDAEAEGFLGRMLRWMKGNPEKSEALMLREERAERVQRAVASLTQRLESSELRNRAFWLIDECAYYVYGVLFDESLDKEGKAAALIAGFEELAAAAKKYITAESVAGNETRDGAGIESAAALVTLAIERAGKKIAKVRLDKISNAHALLGEVIDEAAEEPAGRSAATDPEPTPANPDVTPEPANRDSESATAADPEDAMTAEQYEQLQATLETMTTAMEGMTERLVKVEAAQRGQVEQVEEAKTGLDKVNERLQRLAGTPAARRSDTPVGTEGPTPAAQETDNRFMRGGVDWSDKAGFFN